MPLTRRASLALRVDARLNLVYYIALAASLAFAKDILRLAILTTVLLLLLALFKKQSLQRPYSLIAVLVIASTIFILHSFFATGESRYGRFSPQGCQRGARLALIVVSLWAGARLLFSSARPRDLACAIGAILPFAKRHGSFSHGLISVISGGLLVLPACKHELVAARIAARARAGSFGRWSHGMTWRNLARLVGFALKRLWLSSDELSGKLASRGYDGPERWLKSRRPPSAAQLALFLLATGLTVAILVI
ncbi:MAG: hypothetical protein DRH70_07345 [Candidatus Coatesbacteria bacterium]|nr:MAG: hypothetical protein DRH70_07345 [Candidatus Coatesbacteria bacterium]